MTVSGVIIALIIVLSLIGQETGSGDATNAANSSAEMEDQVVTGTPVTIAELIKAYDDNEAKAQATYDGEMLIVQGEVTDIDLGFTDNPIVTLIDHGQTINTYFEKGRGGKGTIDLVKGQRAVIGCNKIRETMGSPSLHDCFVGDPATITPASNAAN